jgi:hypothetical protein
VRTPIQRARILLPRPLLEKLAARAAAENTDVNTLILEAVKADLGTPARKNRRRGPG